MSASESARLFQMSADVDQQYPSDLPMLLLIGDIPYATECPPELDGETEDDDWWADGFAYECLGEYKGEPVYVFEPTTWKLHDEAALKLEFTLEGANGLIAELYPVFVEADVLEKCVIFNPHDGLDKSLFTPEKFIVFDLLGE